jgi:peptidoglycan/xylan/chitin deacetylase (PgdA/CDA1 family)
MSSQRKPIASISLDLDDKWTYMKTRGNPAWQTLPSYLDIVVPRVLHFLEERGVRITFFIVGQDAALDRNSALLRSIAEAGHEIGNHSFHHEPWLHLYTKVQIEQEIAHAEQCIEYATGCRPRGFRGPGFSRSDAVGEVLVSRGYLFDASALPTFLGPLARAYYLLTADLDREERRRRAKLFGRWRDGLLPLGPHGWNTLSGTIPELPVTTTPIFRTPFHLSYLIYLLSYSRPLASAYLRLALGLCRASAVEPSFLLHPLDFIGPEEAPELAFFPGMRVPLERKLEFADFALRAIGAYYRMVPLGVHVTAHCCGVQVPHFAVAAWQATENQEGNASSSALSKYQPVAGKAQSHEVWE